MQNNQKFFFKDFFISFTNKKAVFWITIIGFFVFSNMFFNGFIEDDKKYIISYFPELHDISLGFLFGPNNFNIAGQYRPIPVTYFSILYSLFATAPFFYHLLQLLLHITVTVLLYIFFQKFLTKSIALFASLIFLVHPINIESVSYIAQTVSPLFTLFGMGALLLLLREHLSKRDYIFGFTLFLLSLLTKETGIIFIFLLFLFDTLFVRKNLFKHAIGVCVTLCVYAFFRIVIGQVGLGTRLLTPIASATLSHRLLNIPLIVFYYIKTFFFPRALAFDQQWVIHSISFSNFYSPLVIDVVFFLFLTFFGIYLFKHGKKQSKPYLFFLLWFLAGLFFHIQIFPLDATVGDRWFYLPMIGLLGILGIVLQIVVNKLVWFQKAFIFIGLIILISLSIRTIIRNTNWHDAITLYTHDISMSDNYDIENSLGVEYQNIVDNNNALVHLKRSVAMRPNEFNLHNLGVTYLAMGNMVQAKQYFTMALNAKDYKTFLPHKHDVNSYKSYAAILLYYDEIPKAQLFLQNALMDYPNSSDLWMFLALVKLQQHQKQDALDAASKAYQLNPNKEDTYIYQHMINNQSFFINLYNKSINFE